MPLTEQQKKQLMAVVKQETTGTTSTPNTPNAPLRLNDEQAKALFKIAQGEGGQAQASVGFLANLSSALVGRPNFLSPEGEQLVGDLAEGTKSFFPSAGRAIGDVFETVTSPIQTAKNVASFAGLPFSEKGRDALLEAGKETLDVRTRLREDPAGLLLDFAGVGPLKRLADISKAGRVGKALEATASASDAVNPIRILAHVAQKTPGAARGIGEDVLGFTTGKGRRVFSESFDAGREGGQRRQGLRAGRTGQVGAENVAGDVVEGFKALKEKRGDEFRQAFGEVVKSANNAGLKLDTPGIKSDLPGILSQFNIRIRTRPDGTFLGVNPQGSGIIPNSAEHRQIEKAISLVLGQKKTGVEDLHALKRQLDKTAGKAKLLGNSDASAVVGKMRDRVRQELSKVPGYDDAARNFAEQSTMLEQMQKSLSIQGQTNETLMTKLTNLLNDRENLDLRRRMIDELEEATGKSLKAQIAGIRTSDPFSGGLGGSLIRGASLLGVGASGALGSFAGSLGFLSLLPFTSPKLMGRFMESLGATRGQIDKVQQALTQVHKIVPPDMVTDGLTLGAVLNRLEERTQNNTAEQQASTPAPLRPTLLQLLGGAQKRFRQ